MWAPFAERKGYTSSHFLDVPVHYIEPFGSNTGLTVSLMGMLILAYPITTSLSCGRCIMLRPLTDWAISASQS